MSSHADARIKNAYTQAYSHRGSNRPKNTLRAYARGQEFDSVHAFCFLEESQTCIGRHEPCFQTTKSRSGCSLCVAGSSAVEEARACGTINQLIQESKKEQNKLGVTPQVGGWEEKGVQEQLFCK